MMGKAYMEKSSIIGAIYTIRSARIINGQREVGCVKLHCKGMVIDKVPDLST